MVKTVKKYKANAERTLLAALILNDSFLEQVHLHQKDNRKPFRSKWSNVIAGWCFDHYAKYQKAPRSAVRNLFEKYAAASRDMDSVEVIESFLVGLSEEFSNPPEEANTDFLVDLASKYFRKVQLERVVREAESALDKDDVDFAESCLASYSGAGFGSTDWIDPTEPETVLDALSGMEHQSLIQFRGDLGKFLSPHFERDGFISFVGPEKRGKSFFLLEVVWQAMIQRRRVLYYAIGDMSRKQVIRRLVTRAIRRPLKACVVQRPVSIERQGKGVTVEMDRRSYTESISQQEAVRAMRGILKKTGAAKSRLKLKCVAGGVLSASEIERDVHIFSNSGWIPDVVVADYADLLAPESGSKNWDYRHQVNESWKVMRRISSDHHLLFVTATQAAASSYNSGIIRKNDFSEDKRKNAHVTGMLGINQTTEEKEQGIYRLNWVFLRDGGWTESDVVWTAGCLPLACPCIVSTL